MSTRLDPETFEVYDTEDAKPEMLPITADGFAYYDPATNQREMLTETGEAEHERLLILHYHQPTLLVRNQHRLLMGEDQPQDVQSIDSCKRRITHFERVLVNFPDRTEPLAFLLTSLCFDWQSRLAELEADGFELLP